MRMIEDALNLLVESALPAHHLRLCQGFLAEVGVDVDQLLRLFQAGALQTGSIPARRRAGRRVSVQYRLAVPARLHSEQVRSVLALQPLALPRLGAGADV